MGMVFFDYLSNYIPVDFYYLIPSKIFDPQAENPQGLQDFWASWGQLAQGLSSVLGSLNPTSGSFFPPESFEKSLLGSLQQGLWENRALEEIKIEPDDSSKSLQFFSASSERRQVEVLRDQLLSLLQQDPELQLSEICIMAPDISPFVGPLTTCLTQGEQPVIPCHFIDIRGRGKASFSQGFLKLLQLAGGRYSRWEIFSLFQNPCFAQAHNITPEVYQLWLKSCDDLHVFWAMDEDHRRSFHAGEGEVNTWDWAFKRLILGMITDDTQHPMVPRPESKQSPAGAVGSYTAQPS
jgi:exodeoxyribonuclease V gamma subunit